MGRIKTQLIKRVTLQLVEEHGGEFKSSYAENKAIVDRFVDVPCKKLRNIIAGYVTRLVNHKED